MERLLFKNNIINIILGFILLVFANLAYFLGWMIDLIIIMMSILIIAISLKRFIYTFKKTLSRNTKILLVFEILLDIFFASALIITKTNMEVYIGLVFYIRGLNYLIINQLSQKPIKLLIFFMNIGFMTLGCFLMFQPPLGINYLLIVTYLCYLLIGLIYLFFGILGFSSNHSAKSLIQASIQKETSLKSSVPVNKLESNTASKQISKSIETPTEYQSSHNYNAMTVQELRSIAKDMQLHGYSKMVKSELVSAIRNAKSSHIK